MEPTVLPAAGHQSLSWAIWIQSIPLKSISLRSIFSGHSGCAVWGVGHGRLVAGIVGSNPAQGVDVCPRLSVLYCPV
jgi:hypothetical protein